MSVKEMDLRGTACPINFVRIKIALDAAPEETIIKAIIDDGEAYESVPQSIREEGHEIISLESYEESFWLINIKKSAGTEAKS
ncbi:MAG: sulfurtransferase TusA family protein [Candidatus Caenarcaniphilales bacterium]|nr:sulfurtransferase TusA family protein [Candidatus Caenarcaniphilales bacterium]